MLINRLLCRTARPSSRGGFTLVELLVVIGIIAILAGVALGPITRGIKQAQESGSMQTCRQVGLMEFAYSNDNSQVYPYGTTSEIIANSLLNGNYATDPGVFYIAATPGSVKPTVATPWALTKGMVSYDFMVNTTSNTGLTATAADGTPLCELTGAAYTMATTAPAAGITATLTTTKTAYGADGIAVTYKSNNAVFLKCTVSGAGTATSIQPIVSSSYTDPNGASYALVVP